MSGKTRNIMVGLVVAKARQLPAEGPPEWIELLPLGNIEARDGRRWTLDDAEAVIAATRAYADGTDLVIDYDHASEVEGKKAPAAGWMTDFEVRDNAIWAKVRWTKAAAVAIEAKEYRYVSPVFGHDKGGRKQVRAIARAALTNIPALTGLQAVAREESEAGMDELHDALMGIFEIDAESNDAAKEVAAMAQMAARAYMQLKRIAAERDTDVDKLIEEIAGDKMAAMRKELDEKSGELAAMKNQQTAASAERAVGEAIAAGKVIPAQRDWALALATTDRDAFDSFVSTAVPIVGDEARGLRGAPESGAGSLMPNELAICRALNLTPEQFRKGQPDAA